MSEFKPPAADAGIPEVIVALKTLHDCVELGQAEVKRQIERNRKAAYRGLARTRATLDTVQEHQMLVMNALGLTEGTRRPVALWGPGKAFGWLVGMAGSFFIAAKAINTLLPYVTSAGAALWQAAIR